MNHTPATPPPSSRARFGIRFSLLSRRWRRRLDAHLAQAGLTDATWVPLVHLDETGGGISQKDLALRVGVDGSSLVRVLDILERQGLIERRRCQADGRARLVGLTPEGHHRVADIRRMLSEGEQALLADLSEQEISAMLACFARIDQRITALERAAEVGAGSAPGAS